MKESRIRGALAMSGLLLIFLLATAFQAPPPTPAPGGPPAPSTTRTPSAVLNGQEIPVPVTVNPGGPAFALEPLVRSLGGELTPDPTGESLTLRLEQTDVVLGIGSAIITVGESIVSLSQPPVRGEGGILVPLDFLRKTWGDLLGYSFDWTPEASRLTIGQRGVRELSVLTDVVHQQGISTVVLQFAEVPRYQVSRQSGVVTIQLIADRLSVPAQPEPVVDPLVQGLSIAPEQIRVELAPGAEAQSYVLENPFRIVIDVHRPASVDVPTATTARPRRGPGIRTIVIDPGHGGTETGAIGPSGVLEKDLTLALARELEVRLERLGMRAVLTRNEDSTVPLDSRPALANQNQGDLFISIHLNSSIGAGAHGTETYIMSAEPSDARAARAAAAENLEPAPTATPAGTPDPEAEQAMEDLQLILWDLAQTHHLTESQRLANLIQGELNQTLQLRDRGVKQAPFRVLMGAAMPAVLVELGFVSHPDEEKKLQQPEYRAALIDALARAVQRYKALVENKPMPQAPSTPAAPGSPGAPLPGTPTPTPAPQGTPRSQPGGPGAS